MKEGFESVEDYELAPADKLKQLTGYFINIASGQMSPDTVEYLRQGGSLRLCLNEIEKLDTVPEYERVITNEREAYIRLLMKPPYVRYGARQKQAVETARKTYVDGVVDKIQRVIEADTPESALELRQLPTLIEKTSFHDEPPSLEDLSANQLYILIDTALCEHIARRDLINHIRSSRRLTEVLGNRALRMSLAGGVFVASVSPSLHLIPVDNTAIANHVQVSLEVLSAAVFGYEAPEEVRLRYLDIIHSKRTKKLHDQLASSRQLSDLALRMSYGSSRYSSQTGDEAIAEHCGTDDKIENLKRFDSLDEEFRHLNNDPGGKPYSGNQSLGYAARLLLERRQQLERIILSGESAAERRSSFIQLCKEIIDEDLKRMEKGLGTTRMRQNLLRGLGVAIAAAIPEAVSIADGATSLSTEVKGVGLDNGNDPDDEDVD